MTEVFTAKTVEEAKALAVKKFGKNANEIKFEIVEEGKKGFLGIGQVDAKVKATYIAPMPKPEAKPENKAEIKPEPKKVKPVLKKTEAPKSAPKQEVPIAENTPADTEKTAPEAVAEPVAEPAKEEKKPEVKEEVKEEPKEEAKAVETANEDAESEASENTEKDDDMEFSLDNFTLIEDESLIDPKVKIACDYIRSIFNAMSIDANFVIYQNETGAVIDIESDNNGTIIGRRGETLDSIQYLCSIIANKGDKDYYRITIDCLGYRSKRKDTLQQLAKKVARTVLRTGRSQTLEPMNPYERRIIHSAVADIEGITSRSVGEEPYRKIVISSTNPKKNNRRNGRRDDRKGRPNRDRRRENFEPREIDLSTSFEKDYKKPKPEDSMEGGLYGKIEF